MSRTANKVVMFPPNLSWKITLDRKTILTNSVNIHYSENKPRIMHIHPVHIVYIITETHVTTHVCTLDIIYLHNISTCIYI